MMRNLKGWAALALSAAMVVSMGACGTSDKTDSQASDDSNSSSTTGYDVSGVKKDEKIAKMLPSSVTKDGKLTVGMDTSYAPAEFLAADGKTPVGFDVDIVKALAKTFGLEADPQTSNFDSIIPSIGSKYDIGVSSFTITPERMKAVDFVSMFKAGSTWVVKKGNPGKIDTSDLCGLKIAVQTGTTQEEEVNKGADQPKSVGLISALSTAPDSTPQCLRIFMYVPSSISFCMAACTALAVSESPFLMATASLVTPTSSPRASSWPSVWEIA